MAGKRRIRRSKPARRGPTAPRSPAILSVVLGILGACAYFSSIAFTLGDGGLATEADLAAGRIAMGVAGLLSAGGVLFGVAGLRRSGRRAPSFLGFALCAGFLVFAGVSLVRGA